MASHYQAGRYAAGIGMGIESCPYATDSWEWSIWRCGWHDTTYLNAIARRDFEREQANEEAERE